jgi:hypothetical protein
MVLTILRLVYKDRYWELGPPQPRMAQVMDTATGLDHLDGAEASEPWALPPSKMTRMLLCFIAIISCKMSCLIL